MARDLAVIGFDGVNLASLGLFLDLFSMMRRRVADQYRPRDEVGMHTRIRLLGQGGRPILAAAGKRLEVDDGLREDIAHMLVHVPDFDWPDGAMDAKLRDLRPAIDWLVRRHAEGAHVSATGRGIWLLAEGGLIGRAAPLPSSMVTAFRLRYPHVRAEMKSPIVEGEGISMARGMAHETVMLTRLVGRLMSFAMGASLAEALGIAEAARDGLSEDSLVAAAQIWLSAHASSGARISELATHLAVSQQTLIRRFRASLGMTPRAYMRLLRVQSAQQQLRETSRHISRIAMLVGYDDVKSFQEAFRAHTGMSASRYRALSRENGVS